MKNKLIRFLAISSIAMAFSLSALSAQEQQSKNNSDNPQRVVVEIQQKPQKQVDRPNNTAAQTAQEWINVGNALGGALGGALKSVVTETKDVTFGKDVTVMEGVERFSKTEVGRFTMLTVAWKVMGNDATTLLNRFLRVIICGTSLIVWTCLYIWVLRKFIMTRSVPIRKTGQWFSPLRKVEYGIINARGEDRYNRKDDGAKIGDTPILSHIDDEERFATLTIASIFYIIVGLVLSITILC